ncbi:hypothetical protein BMS3Bbin03_01402 [bacterium BMS3Bbin03]|nr:hypothetical protein BMS3Bbin03_01402 [bacterium BMS3Bbin03]
MTFRSCWFGLLVFLFSFGLSIFAMGTGWSWGDFLISEEPQPAQFRQEEPKAFWTPDSGFILAWKDYRLGELSYFAQRFDSRGMPVDTNFQVIGNAGMAFLPDSTGMIVGVSEACRRFLDLCISYYIIRGQIFRFSDQLEPPFEIVPDLPIESYPLQIHLITLQDGFFLGINKGGTISLLKLNRNGKVINTFKNLNPVRHASDFSIMSNPKNQWVLFWSNTEENFVNLYAMFFNEEDSVIARNINVARYEPHLFTNEIKPRKLRAVVVRDTAFEFFWADAGTSSLNSVIFSPSGQLLRPIKKIDLHFHYDYDHAVKNFAFTNMGNGTFGILLTLSAMMEVPTMPDIEMNKSLFVWSKKVGSLLGPEWNDTLFPQIASKNLFKLEGHKVACPFTSSNDIFLGHLSGLKFVDSLKVNDDLIGANQVEPNIMPMPSKSFFVTWKDEKGYRGQAIDLQGHLLGTNVSLEGSQILFLNKNRAVNFWKNTSDWGIPGSKLGFTFYDIHSWQPFSRKAFFNGESRSTAINYLKTTDTTFVVMFRTDYETQLKSYLFDGKASQSYNFDESILGTPYLFRCDASSFWVLWETKIQRFSNDLKPQSAVFDLKPYFPKYYFGNGRFLSLRFSWFPQAIFAEITDTTGNVFRHFLLKKGQSPAKIISIDSTRFIILWTKNKEIFARTFSTDGKILADSLSFHSDVHAYRDWPDACAKDGKVLFVWSDTRDWARGYSIYGSLRNVSEVTSVPGTSRENQLPRTFLLLQNYPNPFNAFTTIQYRLPESGRVNLSIFNLEGKKKATLVNGKLPAGFHHVSINATHWPSGIYFYRLMQGHLSLTKKLIVIK